MLRYINAHQRLQTARMRRYGIKRHRVHSCIRRPWISGGYPYAVSSERGMGGNTLRTTCAAGGDL